jgi:hypothetical protein
VALSRPSSLAENDTVPDATVPGPPLPSFAAGADVMSSNSTKYDAFAGSLLVSVTVCPEMNCVAKSADTLNVTKKKGTAFAIDCVARLTADGTGALAGAVTDDVAVSRTPAGAPGAKLMVATCWIAPPAPEPFEVGALTVNDPPLAGTDWTTGADVAAGWASGVEATPPPPQLATRRPPMATNAAATLRNRRKKPDIKTPLHKT